MIEVNGFRTVDRPFDEQSEKRLLEAITCLSSSEFPLVHKLFDGEIVVDTQTLRLQLEASSRVDKNFNILAEYCETGAFRLEIKYPE